MKVSKLMEKMMRGEYQNWKFSDALKLADHCGWTKDRQAGTSHVILCHERSEVGNLNLQEKKGEAKPYQLKQMRSMIERYNLQNH